MTQSATVIPLPTAKRAAVELQCSKCGAPGEGSCHCGVAYIARPGKRADDEAAKNPNQSVRTLAKKTGVSYGTAQKALAHSGDQIRSPPPVVIGEVTTVTVNAVEYAKDHVRELLKGLKQSLSKDEWRAVIQWIEKERPWQRKRTPRS